MSPAVGKVTWRMRKELGSMRCEKLPGAVVRTKGHTNLETDR